MGTLLRLVTLELHHRLRQMDSISLLPGTLRRLLIDEEIPGASLTLVPSLSPSDFIRLLETPNKDSLDYWILRGERSVWPAIGALKVRCAIEVELDRGYQLVRRRSPSEATEGTLVERTESLLSHRRRRAASAEHIQAR